jgi:hypothetical protein
MSVRTKIFKKIADNIEYLNWINNEISTLKQKFPNVSLKSYSEFEVFLNSIVPKLIHKYMILSGSMKVCSGISPDFAEIACTKGFPVFIDHVPGHVRNILLTKECPYIIDLSYIQFLCKHDLNDEYTEEEALESFKKLYKNPFLAIKIEKLPQNPIYLGHPHGEYDNLYNPPYWVDQYDIEKSEKFYPERFKRFK